MNFLSRHLPFPRHVPAPALAMASVVIVQLGSATSTTLFHKVGTVGTTWLTLTLAGIGFIVLVRPRVGQFSWPGLRVAAGIGAATAVLSLCYLAALRHLPLGTASAVEFLGPLSIPVFRARGARSLCWPVVAGLGVGLLTTPWRGSTSMVGILFALAAAGGWAAYILLTERTHAHLEGMQVLAISMPVASLVAAPFGAHRALGHLSIPVVLVAMAAASLNLIIPYALELAALKRMPSSTFGTLMSLDPAVGALVGLLVLGQAFGLTQLAGMACIVVAGLGATHADAEARYPSERAAPAAERLAVDEDTH